MIKVTLQSQPMFSISRDRCLGKGEVVMVVLKQKESTVMVARKIAKHLLSIQASSPVAGSAMFKASKQQQ